RSSRSRTRGSNSRSRALSRIARSLDQKPAPETEHYKPMGRGFPRMLSRINADLRSSAYRSAAIGDLRFLLGEWDEVRGAHHLLSFRREDEIKKRFGGARWRSSRIQEQ